MLVAQLNFKMVDLLTQAHEAEVSRFDYASVNRSDTDFMDLTTTYLEKWVVRHPSLAFALEADRLQPRVAE